MGSACFDFSIYINQSGGSLGAGYRFICHYTAYYACLDIGVPKITYRVSGSRDSNKRAGSLERDKAMFDKMKQLMEMQGKMQEMKRELENAYFNVLSPDGLVKVTMNGVQEVREIVLQNDAQSQEKTVLEKSLKDAYNRAIKRSQIIAAEKMKHITGMNIPGLI